MQRALGNFMNQNRSGAILSAKKAIWNVYELLLERLGENVAKEKTRIVTNTYTISFMFLN